MDLDRRVSLLKPVLVITGVAFTVGLPILTVVWPAAWMWEPRQSEYEQMIGGIYFTLGVFVLLSARQPLRHLSLHLVRRLVKHRSWRHHGRSGGR